MGTRGREGGKGRRGRGGAEPGPQVHVLKHLRAARLICLFSSPELVSRCAP